MKREQQGVALMLLLVALVLGSLSLLVGTFVRQVAQPERDRRNAEALAQLKLTLLGRAATDASLPGSLPCPDANGDGSADLLAGNDCPSYLGRAPYRTLGIPEPTDADGETLWYALSRSFRDDNSNVIDSDTAGELSLNGGPGEFAAILFAPNTALAGQSRASSSAPCAASGITQAETLCATSYLEGGNATRNYVRRTTDASFNDQVLEIRANEVLRLTEARIAREIKACLDDYAAVSAARYPWPAPIADTANQRGAVSTYFGRIPAQPRTLTAGTVLDANMDTLLDALAAQFFALDRYAASNTAANRTALKNAGLILDASALATAQSSQPALPAALTSNASAAGKAAQELAKSPPNSSIATVRLLLQTTVSGLIGAGVPLSPGMSQSWPASCSHVGTAYWSHWRNAVFYQLAAGEQPGGSGCSPGVSCLSLNGSGDYRAMVIVAGKMLDGQSPRNPIATPPATYLEGRNLHGEALAFETYRPTDAASKQVNDRVVCLDGRSVCR
ncbi:MAG: hypothetical protein HY849_06915 [Nitrosomonadales bacterium]|nr:hypothetical protein [Nitrosomonadales bacterium]